MTPAVNLGNWLRKVCPWMRDNTDPLKEEEVTPVSNAYDTSELSLVEQIVFNTLRNNEVTREYIEDGHECVTIGELTVSKHFMATHPRVGYKGEDIGMCFDKGLLRDLDVKVLEYRKKQEEKLEPERLKREKEREARLMKILEEVSKC